MVTKQVKKPEGTTPPAAARAPASASIVPAPPPLPPMNGHSVKSDPRLELASYVTGLPLNAVADTLNVLRVLNTMGPDGLRAILENLKAGEAVAARLTQVEQLPIHSAYLTPTADGTFEVRIDRPGEHPLYYAGMGKFVGTDGVAVQVGAMSVPLGALEVLFRSASVLNAGLKFGARTEGLEATLALAEQNVERASALDVAGAEAKVRTALGLPDVAKAKELTDNFTALAAKYTELRVQQEALDAALAGLSANAGPLRGRLDALTTGVGNYEGELAALQGAFVTLGGSLAVRTQELETLTANIGDARKKYDATIAQLTAIDVAGLVSKVTEQNRLVTELGVETDRLLASSTKYASALNTLDGLEGDVVKLQERFAQSNNAHTGLDERTQALITSIQKREAELQKYDSAWPAVKAKTDTLAKGVEELVALEAGARERVGAVDADATSLKNTLKGSGDKVSAALAEYVVGVRQARKQMVLESDIVTADFEKTNAMLRQYQNWVSELQGTVRKAQDSLAETTTGLDRLKSYVGDKQREAEKAYEGFSGTLQGIGSKAKGIETLFDGLGKWANTLKEALPTLEAALVERQTALGEIPTAEQLGNVKRQYEQTIAVILGWQDLQTNYEQLRTQLGEWQTQGAALYGGVSGALANFDAEFGRAAQELLTKGAAITALGQRVVNQEHNLEQLDFRLSRAEPMLTRAQEILTNMEGMRVGAAAAEAPKKGKVKL